MIVDEKSRALYIRLRRTRTVLGNLRALIAHDKGLDSFPVDCLREAERFIVKATQWLDNESRGVNEDDTNATPYVLIDEEPPGDVPCWSDDDIPF